VISHQNDEEGKRDSPQTAVRCL